MKIKSSRDFLFEVKNTKSYAIMNDTSSIFDPVSRPYVQSDLFNSTLQRLSLELAGYFRCSAVNGENYDT